MYGPNTGIVERQGSCVAIHEDLVFVGFAKGIIKIFDWRKNVELKTLTCKQTKNFNRVNCMDVHKSGEYLVAGYYDKLIVIWDIKKYKVYYELDKTHED